MQALRDISILTLMDHLNALGPDISKACNDLEQPSGLFHQHLFLILMLCLTNHVIQYVLWYPYVIQLQCYTIWHWIFCGQVSFCLLLFVNECPALLDEMQHQLQNACVIISWYGRENFHSIIMYINLLYLFFIFSFNLNLSF